MGYRMSIRDVNTEKEVDFNHKFYGYYDIDKCFCSFRFLYYFICAQNKKLHLSCEEFYKFFCENHQPFSVRLPYDAFHAFVGIYIIELWNEKGLFSDIHLNAIRDFKKMEDLEGEKIIYVE